MPRRYLVSIFQNLTIKSFDSNGWGWCRTFLHHCSIMQEKFQITRWLPMLTNTPSSASSLVARRWLLLWLKSILQPGWLTGDLFLKAIATKLQQHRLTQLNVLVSLLYLPRGSTLETLPHSCSCCLCRSVPEKIQLVQSQFKAGC